MRQRFEVAARARAAAYAERQRHAADRAGRIWNSARPANDLHAYLVSKGVRSHGSRVYKGAIAVPVMNPAGAIGSLQFIGASGRKRFLKGGRIEGGSFVVGIMSDPLCVAQGYATAASIHEATGYGVVVAFHATNLMPVADSGERKSTCDAIFARPRVEWELERRTAMTEEVKISEAASSAFEAKRAGLLDAAMRLPHMTEF